MVDTAPDRRSEILAVATGLFRRKGYRATSLDDIAEVIGFTKPAIYYYFRSKDEILYEIVERIADTALERIAAIARGPGAPSEKLRHVLTEHTRTILSNLDSNTVFYNQRGALEGDREGQLRERERAYNRVLMDLYVDGVRAGELRDVDPAVAVNTLLGAAIWAHRWFDPAGRLSASEVAEQVADLLASGYELR